MTTTADTIMELAADYANEVIANRSDNGYYGVNETAEAALRTAVESLVAERDAAIAALGNPCLDECLKAANTAALRGQP